MEDDEFTLEPVATPEPDPEPAKPRRPSAGGTYMVDERTGELVRLANTQLQAPGL